MLKQSLTTVLIILITLAALPADMAPAKAQAQHSLASAQLVEVTVHGMVCDFCAQGIIKSFKKIDAVESVQVSLKNKRVTLVIKKAMTLSDQHITKTIEDSGVSVKAIERKAKPSSQDTLTS